MSGPDELERCDPAPGQTARELRIAGASLLWALVFVAAAQSIEKAVVTGALAWTVAAIPSLMGVWMLLVYTRYLRRTDELQRLIQLQAMGWAFGGGFFVICGYSLFEQLGAPSLAPSSYAVVMSVLFVVAMLVGRWRYR